MSVENVLNSSASELDFFAKSRSFLQSEMWAGFQKAVGRNVITVEGEKGRIYGFIHTLPFGFSYLYIPHANLHQSELNLFIKEAKAHRAVFIRVEPWSENPSFRGVNLVQVLNRQPQHSLCIQLQNEEVVRKAMHSKTRYNIGLAERKGVMVKKEKNNDVFWKLLQSTTKRDGIRAHEKSYYEQMLSLPQVEQYVAYVADMPVASIITIHHGQVVTYLHGASLYTHRNVMAPYILQWEAIKDSIREKALWYDMWGVAPPIDNTTSRAETFHVYTWDTNHSFHGITRFKAGFGGVPVAHPQAFEIPLQPFLYTVHQFRQKLIR